MADADREPADAVNDELADEAADLILEAEENLQQNRAEQEAFLETVKEEEGAEVLETTCTLIGEYTVDLRATLDGELMDQMGHLDAKVERLQGGDARAYEISETADDISQLLADVIDDSGWTKGRFYEAYEAEGLNPLGVMLERAFEALKAERERREGVADGFRQEPSGT